MRHRQISTGFCRVACRPFMGLVASIVVAGVLSGCAVPSHDAAAGQSVGIEGLTAQQARGIARESYLYGAPMVASYQAMYAYSLDKQGAQYKGPVNSINPVGTASAAAAGLDPAYLYSYAALDLRAEPVVVIVPRVEKRRDASLQVMDLYMHHIGDLGSRGLGGGVFLVAGPSWKGKVPPGITKVIRSETQLATLVARTQRFNPADQENAKRIQARFKVQPLSAFRNRAAPAAPAKVEWKAPVPRAQMYSSLEFYDELAFLLRFAPAHKSETALRERMATLGLRPGEDYDTATLNPALRRALQEGMHDGQNDIDKNRAAQGADAGALFGDRDKLKNDYLARATGAQMGLFAFGGMGAPKAAPKVPPKPPLKSQPKSPPTPQ
ncbi:DUF1254 domain-containing protein [Achromobacter mucicolens]|uniref:DUF1254 domain-containing protein n=1 Tax=Achromobacter mucicolens TaxID=1389922 RepID=UPI00244841C2|nr:DUF1254 domain-containing protein [Achromobacter mucicolens]MDH1521086.1 DUF1254 domain-containing protein [Achromobacter mucicolens]